MSRDELLTYLRAAFRGGACAVVLVVVVALILDPTTLARIITGPVSAFWSFAAIVCGFALLLGRDPS